MDKPDIANVTPKMIEAGLEALTERWPEWPYGERRCALMLADVFRAMHVAEIREKLITNSIT